MADPYLPTSTAESAMLTMPGSQWRRRAFVASPPAKQRHLTYTQRRQTAKLSEDDVRAIRTWQAQQPGRSNADMARELAASGVWPVGGVALYQMLRGESFPDIKADPAPFVPSGIRWSPRFAWLFLLLLLTAGVSSSQALRTLCLAQLSREEETCVSQS